MPIMFVGGKKVYRSMRSLDKEIAKMDAPEKVVISLKQHLGAPAKCVVALGEYVLRGQLIGEMTGDYVANANVHSSISGVVTSIEADDDGVVCVTIENDGNMTEIDPMPYTRSLVDSSPEELVEAIGHFGIVGMGGAGFPTHTKLRNTMGNVNKFLIN